MLRTYALIILTMHSASKIYTLGLCPGGIIRKDILASLQGAFNRRWGYSNGFYGM